MAEVAMIERVARAIAFSGLTGPKSNWPKMWADLEDHERTAHLATARAAIEAMREPTEAMLEAGGTTNESWDRSDVSVSWPKMIDAALSAPQTAS